jgi:hypothetical protein
VRQEYFLLLEQFLNAREGAVHLTGETSSKIVWRVRRRNKKPARHQVSSGLHVLADRSQLIENTWLVCAIRGGFALVVPFNC